MREFAPGALQSLGRAAQHPQKVKKVETPTDVSFLSKKAVLAGSTECRHAISLFTRESVPSASLQRRVVRCAASRERAGVQFHQ